MMLTIYFIITLSLILYLLYPYRKNSDCKYYVTIVSIFEKQTNSLIEIYTDQHTEYDEVMGSNEKISTTQYKQMIKDTYEYVLKYIPEYLKKSVMKYLTADEIKEWILFKINIMYSEKYAQSLVDDDSLMEYESKESLKDYSSLQQTFQDLADKFSDNERKVN